MKSSPAHRCPLPAKPIGAALCVALFAMLLASCGGDQKDVATVQASAPPVTVLVASVVQKTVPLFTELTARTDATDSVDIRARVKAFLQTQNYAEGTMVKAGQVLFTLDKREYEAQLMQAKAQLAKAQADLAQAQDKTVVDTAQANLEIALAQLNKTDQDVKRLKPLAEQRAVPQQDYDNALAAQQGAKADVEGKKASLNTAKVNQTAAIQQAQAAVEAANASIRQAELNMEYCTITTPITGIAGTRQVAPGNLVGTRRSDSADDRLQCQSDARLRKHQRKRLPDVSAHEIRGQDEGRRRRTGVDTGGRLHVSRKGPHHYRRPCRGPEDRHLESRCRVSQSESAAAARAVRARPSGGDRGGKRLLVPQKAVTEIQSAKVVYVVGNDNKVALRSVTLGDRVGQDYIITDGVKAGERIVVEGLQKARPGADGESHRTAGKRREPPPRKGK